MAQGKQQPAIDYRALQSELETILTELQSGESDIDAALMQYERGLAIIKQLENYLAQAENKVTELKAAFSQKS